MPIDTLKYFELRSIKAAKVSEISESTAASAVPLESRVNFHIGNPVQDELLSSAYLRLALGIDISREDLTENNIIEILDELNIPTESKFRVEFLLDLIKKSAPYTPRGGYVKNNPNYLINYFNNWLIKNQQEPLSYDLGEISGKREIILSSGGVHEALRMFLHAISIYLVNKPAKIFFTGNQLPSHLLSFSNLEYISLPANESDFVKELEANLEKGKPAFLILGIITKEETRRALRLLSLNYPLFFIEVNDAPNHLSLAREAKMMNRVLRIMTPGIFFEPLKNLSLVFIAGNANYIMAIETIHFQLKGTPSASEIELLSFLLKNHFLLENKNTQKVIDVSLNSNIKAINSAHGIIERQGEIVEEKFKRAEVLVTGIVNKSNSLISIAEKHFLFSPFDQFRNISSLELLEDLSTNIQSSNWCSQIANSFLYSFLTHHPEYKAKSCLVVSGSSRTALGLLGNHCGIVEVIIPDLSWTYEDCFPIVSTVPLKNNFELNVDGIIQKVKDKIAGNPNWKECGAVAINNPHNATGSEFDEDEVKRLLKWLLQNKVFVIDDLSYQNVSPSMNLRQIKTLRQLGNDLLSSSYITEAEAEYIVTIHSISKTDSFAGARLSVAEIRHNNLFNKFKKLNGSIELNVAAIFLAYLFYRNQLENVNAYWHLRNKIFFDRSKALTDALEGLPKERNRFDIQIMPPKASMYPQLIINKLPSGLSLDWLATGLARQGIGLVPLSTFSRTEKGFEAGRKTFRLTLGGTDNASTLNIKARRVIIDLNRMIAEEASKYCKREFKINDVSVRHIFKAVDNIDGWNNFEMMIRTDFEKLFLSKFDLLKRELNVEKHKKNIIDNYLSERLLVFKQRFLDRQNILNDLASTAFNDKGKLLAKTLEHEFFKDTLPRRTDAFKKRLFDRTVHPTQMYSIKTEQLFERIIEKLLHEQPVTSFDVDLVRKELIEEYFGENVSISSNQESQELILDLNAIISAENFMALHSKKPIETFISFWGDWDGSNRPSGQGHRLIASVLIENVVRQAKILQLLVNCDPSVKIESSLKTEIDLLPQNNKRFTDIFNKITSLTHQLEKRYKGILPFNIKAGKFRNLGMKVHLAQDPLVKLWHHNDRLERKMLELRSKRKEMLEYYFSLNKQIRKTLFSLIPAIQKNIGNKELLVASLLYKDLLKRFIITPRIHQKLITAQDRFAIDTTVHNINEINEIAGKYGNPGMVLALQVSMSNKPEALISLDSKLSADRDRILRDNSDAEIPAVWSIPLFEDMDSVKNISNYLNKIWEYADYSKRINQETANRFTEIITEVFVAGSDLSQQVGQAAGMNLYKTAKYSVTTWLAEKNLLGQVRMKMGSGEPMQRQGGYYSNIAGKPLFIHSKNSVTRFSQYLSSSAKKSTEYAVTPLNGVFAGGDLRTFQSNLSEKLRFLTVVEYSQLLNHIKEVQSFYEAEMIRAGEPLVETRLQFKSRGLQELERLTIGRKDKIYDEFLNLLTENFRQILYGREEDVVGIHIISYFIGRSTPQLRDRPTVRPVQNSNNKAGHQILEKISETIPLSKYGSLLRAISHNQAQTTILGINQLTTGLFRALNRFSQNQYPEGDSYSLIIDRVLPNLPVYEILLSLQLYHDVELTYLKKIEKAFPAGNSSLIALHEDVDSFEKYLILFKRELIRRNGLNVADFFEGNEFIPNLLPTLRPEIAVLMQPDLFNTNLDNVLKLIEGTVDNEWTNQIASLLTLPAQVKQFRKGIWELLERPVYQRVESFVELAIAINSLSLNAPVKENMFVNKRVKSIARLQGLSKMQPDDNMQQFLFSAVEYLSSISQGMIEVPISIIKALKEVEQIIKIEEQPLSPKQQDLLRFYLLQIARLTNENG